MTFFVYLDVGLYVLLCYTISMCGCMNVRAGCVYRVEFDFDMAAPFSFWVFVCCFLCCFALMHALVTAFEYFVCC
jgi:hypothetical protein